MRQIAARLGRDVSTISREVAHWSWRAANTSAAYTGYRPTAVRTGLSWRSARAQHRAEAARARSHQPWRMTDDRLVGGVIDRLRGGWTPEEISGRLPLEFPADPTIRVGVETLYAWIYSRAEKHRGLWQYLARAHKYRRRRGRAPDSQ